MKRKSLDVLAAALVAEKFAPCGEQIFRGNDIMVDMMRPHFPLSLDSASILNRIKEGYLIWVNVVPHISKGARYTIGARIENKFLDLLELAYIAYFTEKEKKAEKITDCVLVLDTLKFLISVAWEGKLISNKQCEDVALKLEEVGKMFGGWKKNLNNPERKTATCKAAERKTVSETEHELVVRIPLVVGFRPIVVQPQTVVVAFQLEDVRVAVGVCVVRRVINDTVHLVRMAQKTGLYFICDRESTDASHQVFSFC